MAGVTYKGVDMEVRSEKKDWRPLFTSAQIQTGIGLANDGKVVRMQTSDNFCEATVKISSAVRYEVSIRAPRRYDEQWSGMPFICSCRTSYNSRYRKVRRRDWGWVGDTVEHVDEPRLWAKCDHMAAVMLLWEHEHGPWVVEETEEELEERWQRIEAEKLKQRTDKEWSRDSQELLPVSDLLNWSNPNPSWFDLETALGEKRTNRFYASRFQPTDKQADVKVTGDGESRRLSYSFYFPEEMPGERNHVGEVKLELEGNRILRSECSGHYCKNNANLCQHQLHGWNEVLNWLRANPLPDQTDSAALKLFRSFAQAEEPDGELSVARKEREAPRKECVELAPRLIEEYSGIFLGYKVGRRGGRMYVLKMPEALLTAADNGGTFALGKTDALDFKTETFLPECGAEVEQLRALTRKRGFNDWSFSSDGSAFSFTGSLLDEFYTRREGASLEYENRWNGQKGTVRLLYAPFRMEMKSEPIRDIHGQFVGMRVRGVLPKIFKGKANSYCLNGSAFSRVTEEEKAAAKAFSALTKTSDFTFQVGLDSLPEFYRRVLPGLLSLPGIRFEDACREEAESRMPEEPAFRFYLSLEGRLLLCRADVAYGEKTFHLPDFREEDSHINNSPSVLRDRGAEERIESQVNAMFPHWDPARRRFVRPADDESLFLFLHEGLPRLESMGTVYATDAVKNLRMERAPAVKMQVSVSSGLLNLEVRSPDYSREELLAILDSYEKRKTYHRLRSGAFLDLTDDEPLYEFETLLRRLRVNPSDAVRSQLSLPVYRALYLDRMLEERDALQVSRDKVYRALIKNFSTIRDADWEVPAGLAEVLRPYQQYGFKWLKTLRAAGFGGILADEMGLGKTVQAIALLQSQKDSAYRGDSLPGTPIVPNELSPRYGKRLLALVVCPASLVYNWQEEIRRFAPSLRAEVLCGGAAQRNALLKKIAAGDPEAPEILLVSYDLLRRNITHFAEISFTDCFLDEAQYIKNQSAAVSKAVRLIRAEHRYALTGTPIENRLSELWSIFDFLMPGFLYSAEEFRESFEEPITRRSDADAAEALRRMTSPFVLRRLKADVLKELPPRLEEVRYVRFGQEQRAVYDAQVLRMRELLHSPGAAGGEKMQIFAGLLRLRQICCDPALYLEGYAGESAKRDGCLDLVRSAVDGGHRMLIFSQFTSMLELLERDLAREGIPFLKLTGETPRERRLGLVNEFNNGDIPVFLISLKAGGTGLNLTGADLVIHYDPWWNLAAQNQATDRAHRIGQTKQLTVYRLIVQDTIEERILALQNTKRDLADSILSGDHTSLMSLSAEELLALL